MSQDGGQQKNTAYGVFVQACWAQHKRQYPDELIHKEIEEFNKQCSVWWYNLSEQERERFQEMADRSNATQALNTSYTHINNTTAAAIHSNNSLVQNAVSSTTAAASSGIPSFGSSFNYGEYGIQGASAAAAAAGQVVNAVVDNQGTVINYSTNTAGTAQAGGHMMQQRTVMQGVQAGNRAVQQGGQKPNQKPIKDPNAPKKPLSAYFLFSQEERLKVKAEFPDYSITEVAKELGRRWATIDPALKQSYEQRYQDSRRQYEQAMAAYKPQKKKKDPNAPKQPLSAYFIFSSEERLKVKNEHPSFSICEVAKELGRRWADMAPEVKQRYQQMAEEGRQKYDQEMAAYRQGNYQNTTGNAAAGGAATTTAAAATAAGGATAVVATTTAASSSSPAAAAAAAAAAATSSPPTTSASSQPAVSAAGSNYTGIVSGNDYTSLLQ